MHAPPKRPPTQIEQSILALLMLLYENMLSGEDALFYVDSQPRAAVPHALSSIWEARAMRNPPLNAYGSLGVIMHAQIIDLSVARSPRWADSATCLTPE